MRTRIVAGSANRIVATAITAVAVIFIIAVSYVFYGKDEPKSAQTQNNLLATDSGLDPEVITKAYEQDSDRDGLSDWEEVLWSTDPLNPDSDGNGVSDKDQVFATNESLSSNAGFGEDNNEVQSSNQKNSDTPQTSTNVLAKELFASYLYSLKSSPNLTPEQQEEMIDAALERVAPLITAPTYTQSEVRSVPATQESRVQYITTVREIIFAMTTGSSDEDDAFLALAQGDREWAIGVLSEMVHIYSTYIDKLRDITVPDDAISIHTSLVQALIQYTYAIEGFTYINTDPLRTATSVNSFQAIRGNLVQTVSMLSTYFKMHENTTSVLENTN